MAAMHHLTATAHKHRVQEERLFQLLFLLTFPLFLALALISRVVPDAAAGGDARHGSLLSEAAAAARSTLAIAFTD